MSLIEERPGAVADDRTGQVRGFGLLGMELSPLTRGLVAYNVAYLIGVWAVTAGVIALFWLHPAWYTFALAFIGVSSRQQALLNCEHECVHRKFVPVRWLNDVIGRLACAAPVGSPFSAARARHLGHHRLLSTPHDPDRDLHNAEPPRDSALGIVRYFVQGLLGGYAVMVLLGEKEGGAGPTSAARADLVSLALMQGVLALVMTLTMSPWIYVTLWLLPLATVTALCHLVRSFVEHAITKEETEGHANRLITIRSNLVERGLLSPYFMNYHAEHHIVPSVPAPRLKQVQKRLAERDDVPPLLVRSSYGSALGRYVRSL